jgi:lipoyl(octanoyl) transferase
MNTNWRLIEDGYHDGAWNMAVDEALMVAVAHGEAPPTLRLYGWRPAAVSLGYFQAADEGLDHAEIARLGFGLVRRPTGGRAILHDDEVTYSVTIPEAEVPHGHSVMASYRVISRGVEAGLQLLGVGAQLVDKRPAGAEASPDAAGDGHAATGTAPAKTGLPTVCFAKASRCDMVVDGRKIVGSAQVRRQGAILQHGSVPMTIDLGAHGAVMPGVAGKPEELSGAACGVADALGRPIAFPELCEAIVEGFREALEITFARGDLSAGEQEQAEQLYREKYLTERWNLEGK